MPDALKITESEYVHHCNEDNGFCTYCRDWTAGPVEPDAHEYRCPQCGAYQVYGAQELLIMGLVEFID